MQRLEKPRREKKQMSFSPMLAVKERCRYCMWFYCSIRSGKRWRAINDVGIKRCKKGRVYDCVNDAPGRSDVFLLDCAKAAPSPVQLKPPSALRSPLSFSLGAAGIQRTIPISIVDRYVVRLRFKTKLKGKVSQKKTFQNPSLSVLVH